MHCHTPFTTTPNSLSPGKRDSIYNVKSAVIDPPLATLINDYIYITHLHESLKMRASILLKEKEADARRKVAEAKEAWVLAQRETEYLQSLNSALEEKGAQPRAGNRLGGQSPKYISQAYESLPFQMSSLLVHSSSMDIATENRVPNHPETTRTALRSEQYIQDIYGEEMLNINEDSTRMEETNELEECMRTEEISERVDREILRAEQKMQEAERKMRNLKEKMEKAEKEIKRAADQMGR
ncbi:hypothetical protein CPB86DRAFT_791171 [Serendipita vermifera]|nr:hypothetical protein CPB86DRAFT_791171 [Serendipita vermifera]